MSISEAAPPFLILLAQAAPQGEPWVAGLTTFGPLGLWVMWMLYRDNRESTKQDQRHAENIASQKAMTDAMLSVTNSVIVAMGGMKNLDAGYSDLVAKMNHHQ